MNELHRAEYLSALGVTSYIPRFVLPLAPQPRQARLPVAKQAVLLAKSLSSHPAEQMAEPARPVRPRSAPADSPETAVLREISAFTAKTPEQPVPVAPVASLQQQVQPFVLSCWWLGEELLAVDSREPGAALPVEALFNNIVRALGWHQLPREQDRLRWPLAQNRFAAAAAAADARDTCSSWLEAATARRPVKSIWLMGGQAREFCSPLPLEQQVTDWNGVRLVAMPSLTRLLQQPERKRDLWQLLRRCYPEQTGAR